MQVETTAQRVAAAAVPFVPHSRAAARLAASLLHVFSQTGLPLASPGHPLSMSWQTTVQDAAIWAGVGPSSFFEQAGKRREDSAVTTRSTKADFCM